MTDSEITAPRLSRSMPVRFPRSPSLALWLSLCCGLAACSSNGPSPGGSCQSNRDCVTGETCISGTCQALTDNTTCQFDEECGFGEFCDTVDGMCKPLVGEDAGVSDTGSSTVAIDMGVPNDTGPRDVPDICMSDNECGTPPADICVEQQCVRGCGQSDGLPCTGGTLCNMENGRCETQAMACNNDTDCVPGAPTQICLNNVCEIGCGLDSNLCTASEICDSTTGRCVPRPSMCMNDTECGAPSNVCEGTQCIPGCGRVGGIQCVSPTPFCNGGSGRCVATPACTQDSECNDPTRICESNNCVPRCDQPGGQMCTGATPNCNATTGRCDANQPCNQDPDCGNADEICISNTCVVRCDRPGGLTCSGATPSCNPTTGRCEPAQGCNLDADCTTAGQICINQSCVLGCDQPGGIVCSPSEVCNATNGRCIPGQVALGASCTQDNQCQSGFCLTLNIQGGSQSFCASACSAGNNCPVSFSCAYVSGMNFCLHQSLFGPPPPNFSVPAGGSCSDTVNNCQTGICDTNNNACIETCQDDLDCTGFGNQCWMWERPDTQNGGSLFDHLCFTGGGNTQVGGTCVQNSDCRSGICDRYRARCAEHCCAELDCPAAQNCLAYDLDANTIVKVCTPQIGNGTGAIGAICNAPTDCATDICVPIDPNDAGSIRRCSTACCSDSDCTLLPQGGRCQPGPGPIMGTITGACYPNN